MNKTDLKPSSKMELIKEVYYNEIYKLNYEDESRIVKELEDLKEEHLKKEKYYKTELSFLKDEINLLKKNHQVPEKNEAKKIVLEAISYFKRNNINKINVIDLCSETNLKPELINDIMEELEKEKGSTQ